MADPQAAPASELSLWSAFLRSHLLSLFTVWFNLLAILGTFLLELLARPLLRLLRRLPPNRPVYRFMRLVNCARLRIHWRQDILESLYKTLLALYRVVETCNPSYYINESLVYVPSIKVQVAGPKVTKTEADEDDDSVTYFEAWAVIHESNLFHSYISESLAQQMKLPLVPPKWDPSLRVVRVALKPATCEIGIPLDASASEEESAEVDPETQAGEDPENLVELIVLPMEQFGRIEVRIRTEAVETIAEKLSLPSPLPRLSYRDTAGEATADLLIGQQLYLNQFLPPPEAQKISRAGGLAFASATPCFGSVLTGTLSQGDYRDYSTLRVIWLHPIVLIISVLILLPVHFNAMYILRRLLHPTLLSILTRIVQCFYIYLIVYTAVRVLLQTIESFSPTPAFARSRRLASIRNLTHRANDRLLSVVYRIVDLKHTLPELVEKEAYEFKQYWYRWIKRLISENQLVPSLKMAAWSASAGPRSVHFEDQHQFLPEESRAEYRESRRRYRPIVRGMARAGDGRGQVEVRVLLNGAVDHSLITQRAAERLGLEKQRIWPRFHWGFYPKDDDMSCSTEVAEVTLAPKDHSVTQPPITVSLLVQARDLNEDLPVIPSTAAELQGNYGVTLLDVDDSRTVNRDIDIVIGQDLLARFFLVEGAATSLVALKDFETAAVRQTTFGWTLMGFHKTAEELLAATASGASGADDAKATFLGSLWSSFGVKA